MDLLLFSTTLIVFFLLPHLAFAQTCSLGGNPCNICTGASTITVGSSASTTNTTIWDVTTVSATGAAPDYTIGGTGTATYGWEDITVDLTARSSGPNVPAFSALGSSGLYGYIFTNALAGTQILYFNIHLTHRYANGTGIYLHAHMIPLAATTNGQQVAWTFSYLYADRDTGTFALGSVAPTIFSSTYTFGATNKQYAHLVLETTVTLPIKAQVDGVIIGSIVRTPQTSAPTPTPVTTAYTGDLAMFFVDAHVQTNKHNTKSKDPPYYN